MHRIGVTGGIGAGKSALVDALVLRGVAAFSADAAVHELYGTDAVRDAVRSRWGDDVVSPTGAVDRRAVADIVFRDEDERRWLEALLHPLVGSAWRRFVAATDADVVVAEVPLLFEAGLEDRYDLVVAVLAPLEVRLARVGGRAGGAADADRRAAVQLGDADKARRADIVIENTGDLADLDAAADRILAALARP